MACSVPHTLCVHCMKGSQQCCGTSTCSNSSAACCCEQPATWVTVLTWNMGNTFLDLFRASAAIGSSHPLPRRAGWANPRRSSTPSGDLQIWLPDLSFFGLSLLTVLKHRLGGSWSAWASWSPLSDYPSILARCAPRLPRKLLARRPRPTIRRPEGYVGALSCVLALAQLSQLGP